MWNKLLVKELLLY